MIPNNLLAALPPCDPASAEHVDELLSRPGVRVERIVSSGQASPPGFWYDQAEGEWIVLLSGAAGLRFEHEHHTRLLAPGDCLDIPAHYRHRVEWTAPGTATIWLAVFYGSSSPWPA
ncbi:cupin [Pseudomonas putida]